MGRDVAKCYKCGSMRFEDDVILDKSTWEYKCRDEESCNKAKEGESQRDKNRMRYRRKVGLSK